MVKLQFHIVDAFVDPNGPFTGNPATVIVLPNDVCNHCIHCHFEQNFYNDFLNSGLSFR